MTRLLMIVFSSAVAFCAQVSTEADKKGAIEGTVVSATTGTPLRKAEVTVNLSGEPHAVATMTDSEGKFVLEDLDPGEYQISATRFGYLESGRVPSIKISDGLHVKNVVLKLIPQGIIAGRVVDDDGDPVPHAGISAMRFAGPGRTHLSNESQFEIDGEGAFKFTDLPPGRYYLSADPRGQGSSTDEGDLIETWYPDALDEASATAINLPPGGEIRDIELRLRRARVFSIRGKVTGLVSTTRYVLQLTIDGHEVRTAQVNDGSFVFGSVLPGSYVIKTNPTTMDWDGVNYMRVTPAVFCDFPVEVGDKDVKDLVVPAAPVGDVTGHIKMASPMPEKHPRVLMSPLTTGWAGRPPGMDVDENGAFRFAALAPDEYDARVINLPEGTYVKSMRYDGQPVAGRKIDLNSFTRGELEITLAPNAAKVTGVLRNENGDPESYETVVLWRDDVFEQTRSGKGGAFEFNNLTPGDYFIVASDDDDGLLFDADVRARLAPKAMKVSLEEGSNKQVEVKLIEKSALVQ